MAGDMFNNKLGFTPLKNSMERLTNFNSGSVERLFIHKSLSDISCQYKPFWCPCKPFPDQDTVFFDLVC
jgi:hypothetical protein